jgi:hypothetical protein
MMCSMPRDFDDGDRVVGRAVGDHASHRLRDPHQLPERAGGIGIVADDVGVTGAQQQRHAGDPGPDGEVLGAAGSVADDLADEFVTHDGVAVGIPHEPGRAVGMIHVVHVRGAQCGAEWRMSSSPGPATASSVSRTYNLLSRGTTARISSCSPLRRSGGTRRSSSPPGRDDRRSRYGRRLPDSTRRQRKRVRCRYCR